MRKISNIHDLKKIYFSTIFILIVCCLYSQHDVVELYYNSDPGELIEDIDSIAFLRNAFLKKAIEEKDSLKIIFGNLYVNKDLMNSADYDKALVCLDHAEKIALKLSDTLLLGRIIHKKANVFVSLLQHDKSITLFNQALIYSNIAKDSQYIAISLEQLGSRYAYIDNYELANEYYEKALPMVESHCSENKLAVSLTNYGCLLSYQDSTARAINILKKVISIAKGQEYHIVPAKHNLAFIYADNNDPLEAVKLFNECKRINEKNEWPEYLIYSYQGLSISYENLNNIDSALYYFKRYHNLKDSLIGTEMQNKINDLEKKSLLKTKELEISAQRAIIFQKNLNLYKLGLLSLILLSSAFMFGWNLYLRTKNVKLLLLENRSNLKELAKLLALKNAELKETQVKLNALSKVKEVETVDNLETINLLDLKILTNEDWHSFKVLFEKSYPGYLGRIRRTYPNMSQAEERLFLFIKISISNNEIANILGVQVETIKKTRLRLRKRLELSKDVKLDDFIRSF